jgi:hypothetical protein
MENTFKSFNIFLSSPDDVKAERQLAGEVINNLNNSCGDTLKISLVVKKWEKLTKTTTEAQIQEMLNKEIKECHFFVLILFKRYGTVEKGFNISNTERELNTILERAAQNKKITILSYFREIPANEDPGLQEKKIIKFKKRLTQMNIMYKKYRIPEEFKDNFTHDLYRTVIRMNLSPYKQEMLKKFFQFGQTGENIHPQLSIVYPAVSRKLMDAEMEKDFWYKRLAPNLFFEDFKAIVKLGKVLRLIGLSDFKVFTTTEAPPELKFMNRIWICLPRLDNIYKKLEEYKKERRFTFIRKSPFSRSTILWKSNSGKEIEIYSPLAIYLKEQRKNMDISGDWHQHLGRIYCKDFAVLARFTDNHIENSYDQDSLLRDFFVAGIRGLGTWGAAWFLDRRYQSFHNIDENSILQYLLEVIYQDGKIYDVIDVSDKPDDYFINENNINTIRNHITNYEATI